MSEDQEESRPYPEPASKNITSPANESSDGGLSGEGGERVNTTAPTAPYARAALDYHRLGWINPLPAAGKDPVVGGYHGIDKPNVPWDILNGWIRTHAKRDIYLRSQGSWIAIDVDTHDGKEGAETLAKAEAELGELPPTVTNTARGADQPSRHRVYRVPVGLNFRTAETRLRKKYGNGIEIIHRDNRGIAVWPSRNPDADNAVYLWYGQDGQIMGRIPLLSEATELPVQWLEFLAPKETPNQAASTASGSFNGQTNPFMQPTQGTGIAADTPEVVRQLMRLSKELAAAPEGTGNNEAARLAFYAGQYVGNGQVDSHTALGIMLSAIDGWTWKRAGDRDAMVNTITRQIMEGAGKPRMWEASLGSEPIGSATLTANHEASSDAYDPAYDFERKVARELDNLKARREAQRRFENGGDPAEDSEGRESWKPVDPTDILNNEFQAVLPEIGRRNDGIPLLYRGKEHAIASEPECGKTWFVLMIVKDVLITGGRVVYVDFEDDAATIYGRLITLGVLKSRLLPEANQFRYIRPEVEPTPADLSEQLDFGNNAHADLVIYDGVTEGMELLGLKPLDMNDAAKWRRRLIRPVLNVGAATISTDHVVKDKEKRGGGWQIGSQHKKAGLNGVLFMLEKVEPFGRGLKGKSRVSIGKDRNGGLRQHGLPTREPGITYMGDLVGDAGSGEMESLIFWPPRNLEAEPEKEGIIPRDKRDAVAAVVKALRGKTEPLKSTELRARISLRAAKVDEAVAWLQDGGFLEVTTKGNSKLHALLSEPSGLEESGQGVSPFPDA